MRLTLSSNSPWEDVVGYSRAVRIGDNIFVAGTTATDLDGVVVEPKDMYAQTKYILDKIERVLAGEGIGMKDVVRTRMYLTDISRWEEVARAHSEYFRDIRPAATMVEVSRLIHPDMLIEIEMTACIDRSTPGENHEA